jgi:hypothetical protein
MYTVFSHLHWIFLLLFISATYLHRLMLVDFFALFVIAHCVEQHNAKLNINVYSLEFLFFFVSLVSDEFCFVFCFCQQKRCRQFHKVYNKKKNLFHLYLHRYRFTQIAVDQQIKTPGGITYDVIFVGTGNR